MLLSTSCTMKPPIKESQGYSTLTLFSPSESVIQPLVLLFVLNVSAFNPSTVIRRGHQPGSALSIRECSGKPRTFTPRGILEPRKHTVLRRLLFQRIQRPANSPRRCNAGYRAFFHLRRSAAGAGLSHADIRRPQQQRTVTKGPAPTRLLQLVLQTLFSTEF